jgi:hypothetical protein
MCPFELEIFSTSKPARTLKLQAASGTSLHFTTTASGAVNWTEAKDADIAAASDAAADNKPSKGKCLLLNSISKYSPKTLPLPLMPLPTTNPPKGSVYHLKVSARRFDLLKNCSKESLGTLPPPPIAADHIPFAG